MTSLAGYRILEQLHASGRTVVHRAVREADNMPVILKQGPVLSSQHLLQLEREYYLLHQFESTKVVTAYGVDRSLDVQALVLEDFGARSLDRVLQDYDFDIPALLRIAIEIVDAIGEIHRIGMVHKDINPSNILYAPALQENGTGGRVKIADFGIATSLAKEAQSYTSPTALEGTLEYLSPEQTGRMNRAVDYRTDYYSLGITLYQMFTGRVPFSSPDPLELVHAHLAKIAPPPAQVRPQIPQVLSDIIVKLISKTAEDRYASTFGIKADLERCLEQLETLGHVVPFEIGQQDISDRFQVPQKLYGRETEIRELLTAFDDAAAGGTPVLLISGYAGIGKSALVHEVHKPITARHGFFISGKFDQFQRSVPYASIAQAFQELVQHLLTETEEDLARWKDLFLEALSENAQLLVNLIPELEHIIGAQPVRTDLSGPEMQSRFTHAFLRFISVIARAEHPLVIFLDDLQWADLATLRLLELIVRDSAVHHVLLIGAYRDNEVAAGHPLLLTLDGLRDAGLEARRVALRPLRPDTVVQMVADTLRTTEESAGALASLIYAKTSGNPFFVDEFLQTLYRDQRLTFDHDARKWKWDLQRIQEMEITDNVVDLMTTRIFRLPPDTQEILQLAACLGNRLEFGMLERISQLSADRLFLRLMPAIREGLLIPLGAAYRYFRQAVTTVLSAAADASGAPAEFDAAEIKGLRASALKFAHDRVQQAAYAMVPETELMEMHARIGRMILPQQGTALAGRSHIEVSAEELAPIIFTLADHWNAARPVLSAHELDGLTRFNLLAAQRCRTSGAFDSILRYARTGVELLGPDGWTRQYALAMQIYEILGEAEYLNGNANAAVRVFEETIEQLKSPMDKARCCNMLVVIFTHSDQFEKGIFAALRGLALVGITLKPKPSQAEVGVQLLRTKWMLWQFQRRAVSGRPELKGTPERALLDLPVLTDEARILGLRLLQSLMTIAYTFSLELIGMAILMIVQQSLRYGNCGVSAEGYTLFGTLLSAGLADYAGADRYASVGTEIARLLNARYDYAHALFNSTACVHFWRHPIMEGIEHLKEAEPLMIEFGDINSRGSLHLHLMLDHLFAGTPLDQLAPNIAGYQDFARSVHRFPYAGGHASALQFIAAMQGRTDAPGSLSMPECTEQTLESELASYDFKVCQMYFVQQQLQARTIFGRYDEAADIYRSNQKGLPLLAAQPPQALYHFYGGLAMARAGHPKRYRKAIAKTITLFRKWTKNCAENFENKLLLLEAESARLHGKTEEAATLYDRSITRAHASGFLHEEALGWELGGLFYFDRGQHQIAELYLGEAIDAYTSWGATGKVWHLRKAYPSLDLTPRITADSFGLLAGGTSTIRTGTVRHTAMRHTMAAQPFGTSTLGSVTEESSALDILTVFKSSSAISQEIVLSKLLDRLLTILTENAGADQAFLILDRPRGLMIEGAKTSVADDHTLPMLVHGSGILPESIISYVFRTKESVVLGDAIQDSRFSSDEYFATRNRSAGQPEYSHRSVLAMPIINQGRLIGILYLANTLVTGAFTQQRLDLLSMLSGQIAIALDNALLYENLEAKVLDRTEEVRRQKDEVEVQKRKVELEMEKSERLLLNILPAETASELKETGTAKVRSYESVTVLFADIRHFTHLCELLSADELVSELDRCFSEFDRIVERHHIEKIKTIGDSYMCAGGIPTPSPNCALDIVRAALEMRDWTRRHKTEREAAGLLGFDLRFGIHSGPVVAGIVGNKKFAYDIWGDTVNIASRMESSGEPGEINLSQATHELVKEHFLCSYRGTIEAKHKGLLEMYFVQSAIM